MFLLLMQFLILYIDRLIGKGLPLGIIVELILTNLAYMVVLAAPMAVLVASLMAFGKFTELNELTALRAAGINPIHTINPVLVAATILSFFLIWFSNDVLPDSNQRARSLFLDIRTKKPGFDLKENEFYDGIEGYIFLVKNITNESDSLNNVTLFQEASSTRDEAIIRAQRGHLKSSNDETITLYLYDGSVLRYLTRYDDGKRTKVLEETEFKRHRISFDLSEMAFSRSNPEKHSRNDRTMDIKAMMAVTDTLANEIKSEKENIYSQHTFESLSDPKEIKNTPRNISPQPTVSDTSYASRYLILSEYPSLLEQREVYTGALRELRSYRSSYESLQVNANWRINRIAQYWVEIHKKISLPLACIIFVLIGAPIGMYSKKGNLGYAALIGTVFLTFFWISVIQGEKLADRLFISPFTGMWFANILLGVIGTFMVINLCTSFRISNLWKNRD
jgi:lipopolysaccharide export system permease protein